ncbi:fibronectin type III domain-containing protein [Helicobacter sp. MIT 14-3879]|uniref:fibronectin type III domain-containing protein n=1 Tax=Helicobacter sp. MIT 14-3879 TaxID=2040649 RepID=UPI000E1EAE92|nr:fibronectin type III domain-containing protein [Helicobacter sp. MIT 14-3879]RDU64736.1 hypothetical protein CQA44_03220 [Helicobacter sp. MIT 14-3879]
MKFWIISVIILFISGCGSSISSLNGINKNLPKVKNIKVIPDVGSIAFEWDIVNNSEVSGFAIYREGKDGFEEIAHIKNPHSTHYVDEGLTPETQYRYYFYTLGYNHYSEKSEIITTKTSFIDPIESIYASNDYPKQVKLLFSPHPNPSISHYLIQKYIEGEFKTIGIVNNRLLVEYFDTNLKDGTSYKYRIIAVDFNSNPSHPSKIITAKTKSIPKIDMNITATNNLINKIIISWNKQEGIKSYNIYRSKSQDGKYTLIDTSTNNEYTDIINANNVRYFYKISGVDYTDLESKLSQSIKGSTKNIPKTPIITKGYVDNNEVKIEWEENNEAKYFIIYRKNGALGKQTRYRIKETNFTDKDIKNGAEYSYYITAIDEAGLESKPSNEIKLSIK